MTTHFPQAEEFALNVKLSQVVKVEPVAKELYGITVFVVDRSKVQQELNKTVLKGGEYAYSSPAITAAIEILEYRLEIASQ